MGERMNDIIEMTFKVQGLDTLKAILSMYQLEHKAGDKEIDIPNTGRLHLAKMLGALNFTVGAEIGVEAGLYSEILFQNIPGLHLYGIDNWTWLEHRYWVPQRRIDRYYAEMKERLKNYDFTEVKGWSMEVVGQFVDDQLDFVYIDADHRYETTLEDIVNWSRKVRSGGIVSGHDFIDRKGESKHKVKQAVRFFCKEQNIQPLFLWGSQSKVAGEYRDDARSWMYVKP
jgi:hypothetical protein